MARQVLAPKPRSLEERGRGSNDRLQADLVDFSQNTRGQNKYGLVVTDVFTREVATKALPDKRAETVTQAAAEIIPDLVQQEGNYVVTTDQGNEFRGLEGALPEVVHRHKDPSDCNATAVIDRAIQTLKKDLADKVARDGGSWGEHVLDTMPGPTRPCTLLPRTWSSSRQRSSGCFRTMPRSSSTTRSSQQTASDDWRPQSGSDKRGKKLLPASIRARQRPGLLRPFEPPTVQKPC